MVGLRGVVSITPLRLNRRRRANHRWPGSCRSSKNIATLCCRCCFSPLRSRFLQMLFPVFTQMVVDKVIVETRHRSAENDPARDARRAIFCAGVEPDSAIPARVCGGAARHVDSRFSQPATALVADELFHQPAHGRHSAPSRWRAAGTAIRGRTGNRRVTRARDADWFDHLDDALQPVADRWPSSAPRRSMSG